MSAGYIQLAAIGQQDAYLTGNPQVTYFSGVYKRHTPFVQEAFEIPFKNKQVIYGQENICKIPAKGDLVLSLAAQINLPPLVTPENYWTWPIESSLKYLPHIILDGVYFTVVFSSVQYYGTANFATWIGSLASHISYNGSQFIYNASTIEVDQTFAVFWGFDPSQFDATNNSNLIYHTNISNLTLQQAGWENVPSLTNQKSGIFLQSPPATIQTSLTYINLLRWIPTVALTSPAPYSITQAQTIGINNIPGGRLRFTNTGVYVLNLSMFLGGSSVASVSIGSTTTETTDAYANGALANPLFTTNHNFPCSDSQISLPIQVTNTSNTYYFFVTASVQAVLLPNSSFSVSYASEIYQLNRNIIFPTKSGNINFYSNVVTPYNSYVVLNNDSTFSFNVPGIYLLSGSLYTTTGTSNIQYISNVSLSNAATIYTYDLSPQGTNPTYIFSMPLNVPSTSEKYKIDVSFGRSFPINSVNPYILDSSSFFNISLIGVTNLNPGEIVPYNGLMLRPSVQTQTLNGPLNLYTNYTKTGNSLNIKTLPDGSLNFSNVGVYMMTAAICTDKAVSSINFGSTVFNVGQGTLPPYTVSLPIYVTYPSTTTQINVYSTGGNVYSNTFISVYQLSSNTYNPPIINKVTGVYNDSVGTWAINTAELRIGGQTIQTLTGEYIEIWNDLHVPYENQPGLTLLTGKYDSSTISPPGRTYITNLPFYFYGNPELALPIGAITRHDVEVIITFRNFSELTSTVVANPSLTATIIAEYAYLTDVEMNWIGTHKIDYLVTQQQYQNFQLRPNFTSAIYELNILNPVREMFFIVQPITNPNYDYSNNGLISLAMSFNNSEAFTADTTDNLYLSSLVPFNRYINYPTRNYYMYSFTTQTETAQPWGQVNMSRIRHIALEIKTQALNVQKELRVCAVNYNVLRVADGLAGLMFNSGYITK